MPTPSLPDLALATAALDFHRALNVPAGPAAADRVELDALHTHLVTLYDVLDAHTSRTTPLAPTEGDRLRACRIRLWQAAEHLHAAYHAATGTGLGDLPRRETCRARLPEGAPALTICRRHLTTSARVRRDHTPADLRDPLNRY
ncbi:DUF6238 family protein [Streptomyces polychromogenes]|uniref:DUF6238 family protein n=1 Tax=Streptomyces polychromogenes TaxID=67342 RepID=A0ABN0VC54_9ACTN